VAVNLSPEEFARLSGFRYRHLWPMRPPLKSPDHTRDRGQGHRHRECGSRRPSVPSPAAQAERNEEEPKGEKESKHRPRISHHRRTLLLAVGKQGDDLVNLPHVIAYACRPRRGPPGEHDHRPCQHLQMPLEPRDGAGDHAHVALLRVLRLVVDDDCRPVAVCGDFVQCGLRSR
jgi:hypothetical protein